MVAGQPANAMVGYGAVPAAPPVRVAAPRRRQPFVLLVGLVCLVGSAFLLLGAGESQQGFKGSTKFLLSWVDDTEVTDPQDPLDKFLPARSNPAESGDAEGNADGVDPDVLVGGGLALKQEQTGCDKRNRQFIRAPVSPAAQEHCAAKYPMVGNGYDCSKQPIDFSGHDGKMKKCLVIGGKGGFGFTQMLAKQMRDTKLCDVYHLGQTVPSPGMDAAPDSAAVMEDAADVCKAYQCISLFRSHSHCDCGSCALSEKAAAIEASDGWDAVIYNFGQNEIVHDQPIAAPVNSSAGNAVPTVLYAELLWNVTAKLMQTAKHVIFLTTPPVPTDFFDGKLVGLTAAAVSEYNVAASESLRLLGRSAEEKIAKAESRKSRGQKYDKFGRLSISDLHRFVTAHCEEGKPAGSGWKVNGTAAETCDWQSAEVVPGFTALGNQAVANFIQASVMDAWENAQTVVTNAASLRTVSTCPPDYHICQDCCDFSGDCACDAECDGAPGGLCTKEHSTGQEMMPINSVLTPPVPAAPFREQIYPVAQAQKKASADVEAYMVSVMATMKVPAAKDAEKAEAKKSEAETKKSATETAADANKITKDDWQPGDWQSGDWQSGEATNVTNGSVVVPALPAGSGNISDDTVDATADSLDSLSMENELAEDDDVNDAHVDDGQIGGSTDDTIYDGWMSKAAKQQCRTVTPADGGACYDAVSFAMATGIHSNPEWYGGLSTASSLEAFQCRMVHEHVCKVLPCGHECAEAAIAAAEKPAQIEEQLSKLTAKEMRAQLKELGLESKGKKKEILERLLAASVATVSVAVNATTAKQVNDSSVETDPWYYGSGSGAYQLIEEEPENADQLSKLTAKEMRAQLKELGLYSKGKKKEILERLLTAIVGTTAETTISNSTVSGAANATAAEVVTNNNSTKGFIGSMLTDAAAAVSNATDVVSSAISNAAEAEGPPAAVDPTTASVGINTNTSEGQNANASAPIAVETPEGTVERQANASTNVSAPLPPAIGNGTGITVALVANGTGVMAVVNETTRIQLAAADIMSASTRLAAADTINAPVIGNDTASVSGEEKEQLKKLSATELRARLKDLGLDTDGKKKAMIARLLAAAVVPVHVAATAEAVANSSVVVAGNGTVVTVDVTMATAAVNSIVGVAVVNGTVAADQAAIDSIVAAAAAGNSTSVTADVNDTALLAELAAVDAMNVSVLVEGENVNATTGTVPTDEAMDAVDADRAEPTVSKKECSTVTPAEGGACYDAVAWAMATGIHSNPEWYGGLSAASSLEAFQCALVNMESACKIVPCGECGDPAEVPEVAEVAVEKDEVAVVAEPVSVGACSTVTPAEGGACYDAVAWAMATGIHSNPEWYGGLSAASSLEAFQCALVNMESACKIVPCGECGGSAAVEVTETTMANSTKGFIGSILTDAAAAVSNATYAVSSAVSNVTGAVSESVANNVTGSGVISTNVAAPVIAVMASAVISSNGTGDGMDITATAPTVAAVASNVTVVHVPAAATTVTEAPVETTGVSATVNGSTFIMADNNDTALLAELASATPYNDTALLAELAAANNETEPVINAAAEVAAVSVAAASVTEAATVDNSTEASTVVEAQTEEQLSKLTAKEMRAQLKELGLESKGKKKEILERLLAATVATVSVAVNASVVEVEVVANSSAAAEVPAVTVAATVAAPVEEVVAVPAPVEVKAVKAVLAAEEAELQRRKAVAVAAEDYTAAAAIKIQLESVVARQAQEVELQRQKVAALAAEDYAKAAAIKVQLEELRAQPTTGDTTLQEEEVAEKEVREYKEQLDQDVEKQEVAAVVAPAAVGPAGATAADPYNGKWKR